jgi:hypothetical protein
MSARAGASPVGNIRLAKYGDLISPPAGPAGAGETVVAADDYEGSVRKIKRLLVSAAADFCEIGYYLKQIRDNRLYEKAGYPSLAAMAEEELGFSKTTLYRYIQMNDLFSEGGGSPFLAVGFKDFSKSSLQEMLYLPAEQMSEVTPDMTVKEIREKNPNAKHKKAKRGENGEEEPLEGQTFIADVIGSGLPAAEAFLEQTGLAYSPGGNGWEDRAGGLGELTATDPEKEYGSAEAAEAARHVVAGTAEPGVAKEALDLKNKDERDRFLSNYRDWKIWREIPELELKFYRRDLANGAAVVVTEYAAVHGVGRKYHLILPESDGYNPAAAYTGRTGTAPEFLHYSPDGTGATTVIDYLTKRRGEV